MGTAFRMRTFQCRTVQLEPIDVLILVFTHFVSTCSPADSDGVGLGVWVGNRRDRYDVKISSRSSVCVQECQDFHSSSYLPI